jgi:disulfide bond formation protein DsbB
MISSVNTILALATIAGQAAVICIAITAYLPRWRHAVAGVIRRYFPALAFVLTLAAISGSLFYSEIAGYTPCKLCWFQRIFMYPQAIILALAIWRHDRAVAWYTLWLSVPGGLLAGYHYLLQIGVAPAIPCSAVGVSVVCSQRFVMQFGYVTIPMMALTAFALIALLSFLTIRNYAPDRPHI